MTHQGLEQPGTMEAAHSDNDFDDWIKQNFDFELWLRTSRATELPIGDLSPTCNRHPDVLRLETVSAAGNLNSTQEILQQWQNTPEDERCFKDHFASSFEPAIKGHHVSIAFCLIDHGITPNWAHFDCALQLKDYSFLELCLDQQGFDLNEPRSRLNPARLADTFEDEKLMQWFLDHGADPNAESETGSTPLARAVQFAPFHIIALLFDVGGPSSIEHGELLLHAVLRDLPDRLKVIEYVLTKGALSKINNLKYHDRPRLAEEENWVIGAKTPVHWAAMTGKLDVVKYLVLRGADPMIPDGKGRLAIDDAQTTGFDHVVKYLSSLSAHAAR
ncbi:MAG: hypothetical protein Q9217_007103 [Psora testacea]